MKDTSLSAEHDRQASCAVSMNASKSVTANFELFGSTVGHIPMPSAARLFQMFRSDDPSKFAETLIDALR